MNRHNKTNINIDGRTDIRTDKETNGQTNVQNGMDYIFIGCLNRTRFNGMSFLQKYHSNFMTWQGGLKDILHAFM